MGKNENKPRRKARLIAIVAAVVVLLAAGGVVLAVGLSGKQEQPTQASANGESEAVQLLRSQLKDESITEVTISGELAVAEPLIVAGTKTISGDGIITVQEGVSLPEGILKLLESAELTLASGSIDARQSANGIYVPKGAVLHISGGEISYASEWNIKNEGTLDISDGTVYYAQKNNIYTSGKLTMSGGTVSDAGENNIYQAAGSDMMMTGGNLDAAGNDNLYGEASSTLRINGEKARIRNASGYGIESDGDVTIDYATMTKNLSAHIQIGKKGKLTLNDGYLNGSSGYGVRNKGVMVMNGGEISSNALSGIANQGTLTLNGGTVMFNTERAITNKVGGTLTVTGRDVNLFGSAYGIYNEENATVTIKDATIQNNGTSNIRNFGTVYLSDSDLLDCGSNSISNFRNGYISIKNVNIERTTTNHAIYNDRGVIEFENVVVTDISARAIQNKGGKVTGSNLTATNCGGAVVGNNLPNDDSQGEMVIQGLYTKDLKSNNVYCENGSIKITDASLAVSPKNSVRVVEGNVTLTNVTIQGTTKSGENSVYGIYTSAGTTVLTNVTIRNTASQAINNRGGNVYLYDVKIVDPKATAIHNRLDAASGAGGNIYGERVTITGSETANVNNEAPGYSITLKDSTLGQTSKSNIIVSSGTVELENTSVQGTTGDEQKPNLFISKGATGIIKGSTVISGAFGKGVNNEGTFYMYGGIIENNRANAGAGLTNSGVAVISGGVIRGNEALTASGGGIINNSGAELTLSDMEISGNTTYTIGGGLALADGSICTMNSGVVKDNVAKCKTTANTGGGGVNIAGGAVFRFLGGTISGNTMAAENSTGVASVGSGVRASSPTSMLYMGGDAYVASDNTLYIHNEACIYIVDALTASGMINLESRKYQYGQIVLVEGNQGQSLVSAAAEKFALIAPWYINEKGKLGNINDIGTGNELVRIYNPDSADARSDGYVYYKALGTAIMDVPEGGKATIELVDDVELAYQINIDGNRDITITDDGTARTIKRAEGYTDGRLLCVTGNASLHLTGSGTDDEPTLFFDGNGVAAKNGQFIIVGTSGNDKNTESSLTIEAGVVLKGNVSTSTYGGVVAIYVGSMTMNGGLITDNTSGSGAGAISVGVKETIFTMNGGTISNNRTAEGSSANGGAINVVAGAEFVMNGGTISGNTASGFGGGVSSNGSFTMTGGSILDNATAGSRGGGVNIGSNGTMTMTGGTISGNTAKTTGGGVSLQSGATMTITGGTVSGNAAAGGAAGIELHFNNNSLTLGNTAAVDAIYFYEATGSSVTLQDGYTTAEAIAVTVKSPAEGYQILAAGAYTAEQLAMFTITDPVYKLTEDGTLTFDGSLAAKVTVDGKDTYYNTLEEAIAAVPEGGTGTIELLSDISVTGLITINGARNITIQDNGEVRSIVRNVSYVSGRLLCAANGSSLTLSSTSNSDAEPRLILDGNGENVTATNGQLVAVGSTNSSDTVNSTLVINPGVVLQNAKITGIGAALAAYTGDVIMNGGQIIHNETTTAAGGALNITARSSFTMNGGVISGNTAKTNGGAVNLAGSFTMKGGEISGNVSGGQGGAFFFSAATSSLIMEGGKISGNTAGTDGGAVHVNKAKGSVTIKGGEISSNVSGGQGGAINTVKGAFVTMDDGTVSGNTASTYGGGILVTGAGGSFTMNGGTISGNSVTKSMGGGVQIGADGTMIMNGGTITGNKAKSGGSGVNVGNSTAKLTMKGGTIQENTGYDISLQSTANEKLVLDGKVTVGTVYIYGGTPYITATGSFQADSPVALSKASAITDSYQLIHFDDSVTDKAAVLAMFAPVETEGWSLNGEGTIVAGSIAAQLSRCLRGIFANLGGDRNV